MTYAISDLHGCYDKYIEILKKINFSDSDTLYVLGDVIDRGDGGINILLDMVNRTNVIPLRGNHEYLATNILSYLLKNGNESAKNEKFLTMLSAWFYDGGKTTYDAFADLCEKDRKLIVSYMQTFFYYEEVTVGGRKFFLAHTVPEKRRMEHFQNCNLLEFTVGEPDYELVYFEDKYIVTGHTPTLMLGEEYTGKIYQKNNHIAIDCGAVFKNPLGCICLDTLQEFYTN